MEAAIRSQIALTLVRGLGPVQAKALLTHFNVDEIFHADRKALQQTEALSDQALEALLRFSDWKRVEEEMLFIERNHIQPLFITDDAYPSRLLSCYDAPILLYYKGKANLNAERIIALVGTRGSTRQGARCTEKIVSQLAPYSISVVSGLAMGIDTVAHKSALQNELPTVAVLPLGLDAVYPAVNRPLAREILRSAGGLLTESMQHNSGEAYLFPKRNRIVAGLSDAVIVMESGIKGGSLITARLAADYGREVFALPGRPSDVKSQGCNALIKQHRAVLFESGDEIAAWMGWEKSALATTPEKPTAVKKKMPPTALSTVEAALLDHIHNSPSPTIDQLKEWTHVNPQGLAAALINLELGGLIVSLPGNRFQSI